MSPGVERGTRPGRKQEGDGAGLADPKCGQVKNFRVLNWYCFPQFLARLRSPPIHLPIVQVPLCRENMSSSQDLPAMGERGLDALRKDLTEDVLRSRKEGCWVPADREVVPLSIFRCHK